MEGAASEGSRALGSIDLIRRFQAGDPAALERLFERYYRRVREIARVRAGPRVRRLVELDDLVQEAFLSSLSAFERFDVNEEGRLVDWFARVVERRILAVLERQGAAKRDRAGERSLDDSRAPIAPSELPCTESTRVPSRVARDELSELVVECLHEMPERRREVILLRDFGEGAWSYVADRLDCKSADAARQLYLRARDELRDRLQRRLAR